MRSLTATTLALTAACASPLPTRATAGSDGGVHVDARLAARIDSRTDARADAPRRDTGADATRADAPPPWLGDAGLVVRAPVTHALRTLCGLASNPGDFPLGTDTASVSLRAGYFAAALDLGGVMIRRDFSFSDIEPAKGTFDFTGYDAVVAEAGMSGVRLLAVLDYGTLWAHPDAANADYPPDPGDYAGYAAAVASRYEGKLAGVEIWNEPNNGFRFWQPTLSGDPVAYGTLLATAAPAIRTADPGTPVMLGGTVFTPQLIEGAIPWLEAAYAARPDLVKSFDVAGIHAYQSYPPTTAPELGNGTDDPPLEDKIRMHAWLLAQHGGAAAPIWITEIGWPVQAGIVDLDTQARYLVRATILAARSGASGIFWYTLRDGPDPTAFPPEGAFGLLHYDADADAGVPPTPKPAYGALKTLLSIVGNRWPEASASGAPGPAANVYSVVFSGSDPGSVLAAWTADGAASSIVAPMGGTVVEQDGSTRGLVNKGDVIAIDGDVTYLH